jgi:hypothetical protein
MTRILAGIAALTLMGAATLPLPASAAEHGATRAQSTELSSQRHWRGHHRFYARRYWGPRRHWGPRYGYYGYRYGYPYGYPYGYHRPGFAFGFGPFGVRVF